MTVHIEANEAAEFEWSGTKHKIDYDKPVVLELPELETFRLIMSLKTQLYEDVRVCCFNSDYDVELLIDNGHYYD